MNIGELARSQSMATAIESSCCLLSIMQKIKQPKSLLDVGCGNGHLVKIATSLGIASVGVDIGFPSGPNPGFLGHILYGADLRQPWNWTTAEWVLCWEVGEHLPESASDTLCNTLFNCTDKYGKLFFSAAIPCQGGAGHINEQPHQYWINKLVNLGFVYDPKLSEILQWRCKEVAPAAWWYGQNMLAFSKE